MINSFHVNIDKALNYIVLLLTVALFNACNDKNDEPIVPDVEKTDGIAFFTKSGGVIFNNDAFNDYNCSDPCYSVNQDCFEVIDDKWYALEYTPHSTERSDVYLIVNGEKKSAILTDCSYIEAHAYQQDGDFRAFIHCLDKNFDMKVFYFSDGKIEDLKNTYDHILRIRQKGNDVYMMVINIISSTLKITKNGDIIKEFTKDDLNLPQGTGLAGFRDFSVDGTDLYMFATTQIDEDKYQACYLKNDAWVMLDGLDAVDYGQVINGKVCAIGLVYQYGDNCTSIWNEGQITRLSTNQGDAFAIPRGLVVFDNAFYYLVSYLDDNSNSYDDEVSILYKDGVEIARFNEDLKGFKLFKY